MYFLLFTSVNLCNIGEKIENTAGITPFVVVPRNKLDKVVIERNTGLGIEDGGVGVAVQVSGDDFILGVGQYTYGYMSVEHFSSFVWLNSPFKVVSEAFFMTALISS